MELQEKLEELDNLIKYSKFKMERDRATIVKMRLLNFKTEEICKVLTISVTTVNKWNRNYLLHGISGLKLGYKGREPYLTKAEREIIKLYIMSQDHITTEELIAYIQEKYKVTFKSKQSYYALLHESRKSWHKSQKVNPKTDQAKVIIKRESIKKNSKIDLPK